ncbi:LysR substrate-binding domain-containing protein [Kosakonia sp. H02]|nr:LysR substrate-binding domain-containing protein [Kosakonia sp. H02]
MTYTNNTVRIHAFRLAARLFLDNAIPAFLAAFPDVQIELTTHDETVDLVSEGYDLSLRPGDMLDPGLDALPLGDRLHHIVVAAPAYLARHGTPQHPDDLCHHNCIGWRRPGTVAPVPWLFQEGEQTMTVPVAGNLVVDDRERQYQAAMAGTGIAQLTAESVIEPLFSGELVAVLTPWERKSEGYYLCWTADKAMSPAMRALIDALCED